MDLKKTKEDSVSLRNQFRKAVAALPRKNKNSEKQSQLPSQFGSSDESHLIINSTGGSTNTKPPTQIFDHSKDSEVKSQTAQKFTPLNIEASGVSGNPQGISESTNSDINHDQIFQSPLNSEIKLSMVDQDIQEFVTTIERKITMASSINSSKTSSLASLALDAPKDCLEVEKESGRHEDERKQTQRRLVDEHPGHRNRLELRIQGQEASRKNPQDNLAETWQFFTKENSNKCISSSKGHSIESSSKLMEVSSISDSFFLRSASMRKLNNSNRAIDIAKESINARTEEEKIQWAKSRLEKKRLANTVTEASLKELLEGKNTSWRKSLTLDAQILKPEEMETLSSSILSFAFESAICSRFSDSLQENVEFVLQEVLNSTFPKKSDVQAKEFIDSNITLSQANGDLSPLNDGIELVDIPNHPALYHENVKIPMETIITSEGEETLAKEHVSVAQLDKDFENFEKIKPTILNGIVENTIENVEDQCGLLQTSFNIKEFKSSSLQENEKKSQIMSDVFELELSNMESIARPLEISSQKKVLEIDEDIHKDVQFHDFTKFQEPFENFENTSSNEIEAISSILRPCDERKVGGFSFEKNVELALEYAPISESSQKCDWGSKCMLAENLTDKVALVKTRETDPNELFEEVDLKTLEFTNAIVTGTDRIEAQKSEMFDNQTIEKMPTKSTNNSDISVKVETLEMKKPEESKHNSIVNKLEEKDTEEFQNIHVENSNKICNVEISGKHSLYLEQLREVEKMEVKSSEQIIANRKIQPTNGSKSQIVMKWEDDLKKEEMEAEKKRILQQQRARVSIEKVTNKTDSTFSSDATSKLFEKLIIQKQEARRMFPEMELIIDKILENSTSFVELNLNGHPFFRGFSSGSLEKKILSKQLAESLALNTHLLVLNCASASLDDSFVVELTRQMRSGLLLQLEVLNVESNLITTTGMFALADILEQGFHPNKFDASLQCGLLELRIDNQKETLSFMAQKKFEESIRFNTVLLKFGASIRNPTFKQKVDFYLMRNIDFVRTARLEENREEQLSAVENIIRDAANFADSGLIMVDYTNEWDFIKIPEAIKLNFARSLSSIKSSLIILKLRDMELNDQFGMELGKALQTNSKLEELNLDFNKLKHGAIESICTALSQPNCSLKIISIDNQEKTKPMDMALELQIANWVKSHPNILKLSLDFRSVEIRNQIFNYLQRNLMRFKKK